MTRLVLHAGAEFADGGAVMRALAGWREPLQTAGVLVPPSDDPAAWRETAQGALGPKLSLSASDLLERARSLGAETVLVSSDALADTLTSPDQVATLADTARAAGLDVRVVVVVREQIGYINALYCRRVLTLETARSFEEFATTSVPAHRFDYVASFGAIADADGIELVAVPYPDLSSRGAGRAVLAAAGINEGVISALPGPVEGTTGDPGPVVVGAARLLHKRMRRLSMFNEYGKPRLRAALDELVARAVDRRWDDSHYWGWDAGLRRRTEEEYGPSNEMFAEFVWGGPWPEPWSAGKTNRVDLAALKPGLLEDVFNTVERLLDNLGKLPGPAEPHYDIAEDLLSDDEDES